MSTANNNTPPKKIDCPSRALADESLSRLSSFTVQTFDPLIRQCYALSQVSAEEAKKVAKSSPIFLNLNEVFPAVKTG